VGHATAQAAASEAGLRRAGLRGRVAHVIELLDESYAAGEAGALDSSMAMRA